MFVNTNYMSTLVLNADAQPTSLLPLSVVDWQEAIRYLVLDKVSVMSWYDDWIVHSASWSTRVPAVIMLKEYQKPKHYARLSKRNVFLRDLYKCQYCGADCNGTDATLDHVLPLSKGGKSVWTNLTTACKPCNYRKANQTKIKPKSLPHKPDFWELAEKRRQMGFHYCHPSWADYLG
jgi:5-methylcytosine-specific restriction endonuclease McrA